MITISKLLVGVPMPPLRPRATPWIVTIPLQDIGIEKFSASIFVELKASDLDSAYQLGYLLHTLNLKQSEGLFFGYNADKIIVQESTLKQYNITL